MPLAAKAENLKLKLLTGIGPTQIIDSIDGKILGNGLLFSVGIEKPIEHGMSLEVQYVSNDSFLAGISLEF